MRFLHIADLHIGKVLHKRSLLDDQIHILNEIVQIAVQQKVDAVLIAGDVYQRSTPAADAMTVFSDFIAALVRMKLPCYIISGNHDSAERVAYFAPLAEMSGVYISGMDTAEVYTHTLTDEFGEIVLHMLPFTSPLAVREKYKEQADAVSSYDAALRVVMEYHPVNTEKRNIILAHQFLTGAQICDSEELAIGGLDNISVSLFDDYDYAALGHLHGPQQVSRPTVRYAGSPLKYSFSELTQKKSVTVVDLREKGNITIEAIPLHPKREMNALTGTFAELMAKPRCEDYMQLTVTDEEPPAEAVRQLRTVYPYLMHTIFRSGKFREDRSVESAGLPEKTAFSDLLCEFYAFQNQGMRPNDAQMEIVSKLHAQLDTEVGET